MTTAPKKVFVGATLSWEWVNDWRRYVEIAKRFGCRFDTDQKLWRIPTLSASIEVARAFLEFLPAEAIVCNDFETRRKVPVADYVAADYSRQRNGLGRGREILDARLSVEGKSTFIAFPVDEDGDVVPEHAMLAGLAQDACKGTWVPGRGMILQQFQREAVDYVVNHTKTPTSGAAGLLFETPFICDTYPAIMPHQERGVTFLYSRRRALLADDMGLGKTMQSIIAAEQVKADGEAEALVVLCPVTLVPNWHKELKQWESSFQDLHIVPYSRLKKLDELSKKYPGGKGVVLIADEAHYLKNPSSQRTKAALSYVAANAALSRLWLLTGTPVTRDFSNLWPLAALLKHPVADKYRPSEMTALSQRGILRLSGAMRTHMMVRKKTDVLDLPPKMRQVESIDTGLKLDDIKMLEAIAYGDDAAADEHIMRIKRQTAMAKVEATIEKAQQVIAEGRKVVLFTDHTGVVDALQKALADARPVTIDGRTPMAWRKKAVDLFQEDEATRAFIGNITAAGVGITLTAASDVIFNDFNWLPANMFQAEDRCHRIGARGTVNVWYLADCNLILDELLCEKIATRSEEIATFEQSKQTISMEIRAWAKKQLKQKRQAHG